MDQASPEGEQTGAVEPTASGHVPGLSFRKNEVCTPHTVVAQKNADGIYTTDCEYRAFRKVPDNSR